MTLSTRNRLMIAGFLATLPALGILALSYPAMLETALAVLAGADARAGSPLSSLVASATKPSAWAVLSALPFMCVYASATLILLHYSFEKTQAPEVLFFAFFALSFAAEALRVAVPLALVREWPPAYLVGAARGIAFGRIFGALSLFASSVYASGTDFQKHGRIMFIMAISALIVATGMPVDGLGYDTSLTPLSGYRFMFEVSELAIASFAVVSYLVAGYSRGAGEFYAAGAGALLAVVGRDLLLRGDSWAAVIPGTLLLCGGTWLFAVKIHRYYLWL